MVVIMTTKTTTGNGDDDDMSNVVSNVLCPYRTISLCTFLGVIIIIIVILIQNSHSDNNIGDLSDFLVL